MATSFDENKRMIEGASVKDQEDLFSHCPAQLFELLKDVDLSDLIYWKLKEQYKELDLETTKELLQEVQQQMQRSLFTLVLDKTRGNQSKAASILGCNRNTLHRKLRDIFIKPKELKRHFKNKAAEKSHT